MFSLLTIFFDIIESKECKENVERREETMTSIWRPGRRHGKQNLSICQQKSENSVQCNTGRDARGIYKRLLCKNKNTNRNAHKELSEWLRQG